jgi:NTP pyrophosphatase (non-canonical NTP hydrolase)
MLKTIHLPKLNQLQPTLDSTLLKLMEEAGELARAVLRFLPYDDRSVTALKVNDGGNGMLKEVAAELLDVAQTCVTMLFVMEEIHGIQVERMIAGHLIKLQAKGYVFDADQTYSITTIGNFKYLDLPKLVINGVTLLTTVCKIQEELGELTQYLGKRAGASGEKAELDREAALNGCAKELLDVAQCCFTMMYILAENYGVDMERLAAEHIEKLRRKGYCA